MRRALVDGLVAAAISAAAILAGLWAGDATAQTVGINLVTAHTHGGFRSWTPGAYVRTNSGVTAGVLRNSFGRTSLHLSQTWAVSALGLPVDLQAGGITGYRAAPVIPLLTASVRLGQHHRLILIPGGTGAAALHLAVEF